MRASRGRDATGGEGQPQPPGSLNFEWEDYFLGKRKIRTTWEAIRVGETGHSDDGPR